jgi:hypothetical protein
MKKKKLTKKCYLCEKEGACSRDHVPPKGIFPKEIRRIIKKNLLTVPAHSTCNNSYKQDDELFRNFIIAHSHKTWQGRFAWDNTVVPSFKKNPGARIELLKRFERKFIKDELLGAYVYSGGLKWEDSLIRRQIERINRGLYYYKNRQPLAINIPINYNLYDNINIILPKIIQTFYEINIPQNWKHIIPGFFTYLFEIAEEDNEKGLSVLIFYDSLIFLCSIGSFDWTKIEDN